MQAAQQAWSLIGLALTILNTRAQQGSGPAGTYALTVRNTLSGVEGFLPQLAAIGL